MKRYLSVLCLLPSLAFASAGTIERFDQLPAEAQKEFKMFESRWEELRPELLVAWHEWQKFSEEEKIITRASWKVWATLTPREKGEAVRALKRLRMLPLFKQNELLDRTGDLASAKINAPNGWNYKLTEANARNMPSQPRSRD